MGDRVAGLPEGTFSGSIDFQMRLPCVTAPVFMLNWPFLPLRGAYPGCARSVGNAATLLIWVASNGMVARLGLVSRPMKQVEFRDSGSNFEV